MNSYAQLFKLYTIIYYHYYDDHVFYTWSDAFSDNIYPYLKNYFLWAFNVKFSKICLAII